MSRWVGAILIERGIFPQDVTCYHAAEVWTLDCPSSIILSHIWLYVNITAAVIHGVWCLCPELLICPGTPFLSSSQDLVTLLRR
jgi:hypothetical protein